MSTHSSVLAWEIPWAEEPGGLQSMGPQKSQTWLSDQTPPPPILHLVSMRNLLGKILIKLYTYLLKSGTIHRIQNGNKCNYILSPPMVEIIIHHLWYSCSFFLWLIFLSLSSMGQMSSCCSSESDFLCWFVFWWSFSLLTSRSLYTWKDAPAERLQAVSDSAAWT